MKIVNRDRQDNHRTQKQNRPNCIVMVDCDFMVSRNPNNGREIAVAGEPLVYVETGGRRV